MSTAVLVHRRGHRATGLTEAGESWRAAAERIAVGAVWPLDLSGEVKQFTTATWPVIALRPMSRADLPDVSRWQGADHVRRWFGADGDPTLAHVTAYYGPAIDGADPTDLWVLEVNGRSVGFCQAYRTGDVPDAAPVAPHPDTVGIDYAIGEPWCVGRGIGTRMLWALLAQIRRTRPGTRSVLAAPDHRNVASLRALEKVGFRRGTWFDERQPDGSVTTMIGCTLDADTVIG